MTKLDDIFSKLLTSYVMPYTPEYEKGKENARQQIKDLFLDIIDTSNLISSSKKIISAKVRELL